MLQLVVVSSKISLKEIIKSVKSLQLNKASGSDEISGTRGTGPNSKIHQGIGPACGSLPLLRVPVLGRHNLSAAATIGSTTYLIFPFWACSLDKLILYDKTVVKS